jgi:hypothetical protein
MLQDMHDSPVVSLEFHTDYLFNVLGYAIAIGDSIQQPTLRNNPCAMHPFIPSQPNFIPKHLVEGRWSLSDEELGAGRLGNAVRKWEFQALGQELLNVWTLDVVCLLEFDDLEDLFVS